MALLSDDAARSARHLRNFLVQCGAGLAAVLRREAAELGGLILVVCFTFVGDSLAVSQRSVVSRDLESNTASCSALCCHWWPMKTNAAIATTPRPRITLNAAAHLYPIQ